MQGRKLVQHRHFFWKYSVPVRNQHSGIRVSLVSGITGHGLVRHCPALQVRGATTDVWDNHVAKAKLSVHLCRYFIILYTSMFVTVCYFNAAEIFLLEPKDLNFS
jgi:hypothetical protein